MGVGRTHVGGGSRLAYVASFWPNRNSSLPNLLCVGLLAPTAQSIWPIERRYCYKDCFLFRILMADRRPARTRSAKIWRKGIGSPMPWRSTGISSHLHNLRHWDQAVESFW